MKAGKHALECGSSAAPRWPTPPPSPRAAARIAAHTGRSWSWPRRWPASPTSCSRPPTTPWRAGAAAAGPSPPCAAASRVATRCRRPAGAARRRCARALTRPSRVRARFCAAVAILQHLAPRTRDLHRRPRRAPVGHAADRGRSAGPAAGRSTSTPPTSSSPTATTAAPARRLPPRPAWRPRAPPASGSRAARAGRARLHRPRPDGSVATLGRGGIRPHGDAARPRARRRVVSCSGRTSPGILTADPRLVPDARLIPQLHHQEAAEVAHYGAKVLHPRALIPISGTRITLRVRSFLDPDAARARGPARRSRRGYPVKALAVLPGQAVVTVAGKGMVGVHGIAARTFAAVDAERLSVSTIFQASSESSIGFTVPEARGRARRGRLRRAFATRSPRRDRQRHRAPGLAVIAVVGDGMAGTPGIAARVFSALETRRHQRRRDRAGIVGAEHLVRGRRRRRAGGGAPGPRRLPALEDRRRPPAGATLAPTWCCSGSAASAARSPDQIADAPEGRAVRIVGLLDRSGYVFDARGLSRARLRQLAQRQGRAARCWSSLGGAPAKAAERSPSWPSHAVSRPVVVDVTSDETGAMLHDGARPRVRRRAGQQEAAGRDRADSYARCLGCGRGARTPHPLRGHGRRRPAGHRHLSRSWRRPATASCASTAASAAR